MPNEYDIFISYSREDQHIADTLAKFLALRNRSVFLDLSSISPGEPWAAVIQDAINSASMLVVLHCCHSLISRNVEAEIDLARQSEKTIVPALLCSAPMGEPLRRLQWIDLRAVIRHSCQHNADVASSLNIIPLSRLAEKPKWSRSETAATIVMSIFLLTVLAVAPGLFVPTAAVFTFLLLFFAFGVVRHSTTRSDQQQALLRDVHEALVALSKSA